MTVRCVRAAIVVVVEEQYEIHIVCVCSRRYPTCNALGPYCHLRPALLYISPHYLITGTIFGGKNLLNVKYVLRVSLHLFSETYLILRITEGDVIKNVYWLKNKRPT